MAISRRLRQGGHNKNLDLRIKKRFIWKCTDADLDVDPAGVVEHTLNLQHKGGPMASKLISSKENKRRTLAQENFEFRRLMEEHQQLEASLKQFESKKYLTQEEELQRKKLQKQKLRGKDKMEELLMFG